MKLFSHNQKKKKSRMCKAYCAASRKATKKIIINLIFLFLIFHPQLDVQLQDEAGGDISSFITNGEWDLLGRNSKIIKMKMKRYEMKKT